MVVVDDGNENLKEYFNEITNCLYLHLDCKEKEKFMDNILEGYKQPNKKRGRYLKSHKSRDKIL